MNLSSGNGMKIKKGNEDIVSYIVSCFLCINRVIYRALFQGRIIIAFNVEKREGRRKTGLGCYHEIIRANLSNKC